MTTCSEITAPYFEALLHFKNTLQEMTLNIEIGLVQDERMSLSIYGEFEDVLRPSAVRDWTDSSKSCPADYLQYLFYKYSSIETIEVDAELDDEFIEINMNRISSVIKYVPNNKQIVFTVVADLDLREIASIWLRCHV
ncbi:hypothetical protein HMPREF1544_07379 [Mucor circinelloides 1006PhL]|uniref:Uncharacterized protein n=1 Tax=Mucor circinelloides f. circinelloides (strain 1006PhL) TaxID=1220926 RepID=S2JBK2_MUCC1|nr:hypothetical protein HMPREF1544_07379 [Mucor circinelloides 1006PhL]